MLDETLVRLTGLIEDAALDEGRWPEVLERTAAWLGAANASMVRHDHVSGLALGLSVGLDPAAQSAFVDYYSARNVLRQHSEIDLAYGRHAVTVRRDARDAVRRSEYYNDFLVPNGMAHLAWLFLHRDGNDITLFNVGRGRQREEFGTADLARLTTLMPHLMRALRVARRLGGVAGMLPDYLDGLTQGVVLLDAMGRILHANRPAAAMAAPEDGIALAADGLLAATREATRGLRAAIARAAGVGPGPRQGDCLVLPRPSGRRPFAVAVCPLAADAGAYLFGHPAVLVEIRDLAATDPAPEGLLARCFALTATEARVAGLLLEGLDRQEIAARLGIAGNTARTHIARLMGKTDTHRQAELVQLLGRAAALHRPQDPH